MKRGAIRFACMVPIVVAAASPGTHDALRERFLREYPAAEARLRERSHRDGVGHAVEVTVRKNKDQSESKTTRKLTYYLLGEKLRFDDEMKMSVIPDAPSPASPPRKLPAKTCRVFTGDGSFLAEQLEAGGPFTVGIIKQGRGRLIDNQLSRLTEAAFKIDLDSVAVYASNNPSVVINAVTEVQDGGRSLLRVEFGRKHSGVETARGWFQVDPSRGWILNSWHTEDLKSGISDTVKITYKVDGDNLPVPSMVVREGGNANMPIRSTMTLELLDFQNSAAKPADFEFAAFGLPDVGKPSPTKYQSNAARWLLAAAGAALLVAIGLRYAASRRRRAEAVK